MKKTSNYNRSRFLDLFKRKLLHTFCIHLHISCSTPCCAWRILSHTPRILSHKAYKALRDRQNRVRKDVGIMHRSPHNRGKALHILDDDPSQDIQ